MCSLPASFIGFAKLSYWRYIYAAIVLLSTCVYTVADVLPSDQQISDCSTNNDCPSTSVCCLDGACAETTELCGEEFSPFSVGERASVALLCLSGKGWHAKAMSTFIAFSVFDMNSVDINVIVVCFSLRFR